MSNYLSTQIFECKIFFSVTSFYIKGLFPLHNILLLLGIMAVVVYDFYIPQSISIFSLLLNSLSIKTILKWELNFITHMFSECSCSPLVGLGILSQFCVDK